MVDQQFDENLIRMIAAELHLLNAMTAAREMFAKGYFSLGPLEKTAVDSAVMTIVAGNFQAITPAVLAGHQPSNPMGFGAHVHAATPPT